MIEVRNFIGGGWHEAAGKGWLDDFEPATGQPIARLPDSGPEDIDIAVEAATSAYPDWAARPVEDRADLLERLAGLVAEHREELAELESRDTGKPLKLARSVDMHRAEANLRFFAGAVRHLRGESYDMGAAGFNYVLRQPLGVVACITPWNLPLYLLTWKLAPALATGNTVIAKPSELTPLSAHRLSELVRDAGFPAGVLNVVHGTGARAGQSVVDHPAMRAISFTGGTDTGRRIATAAGKRLARVSLELGGKNPAIVFADAELDRVVPALLRSGFTNQGQVCLCTSRILVAAGIHEALRSRLVAAVSGLRVGDPLDPESDQGAVISGPHRGRILDAIESARRAGATIHCGGRPVEPDGRCRDGWFVAPTVIDGLPGEHPILAEEVFGPLITLEAFDDEDHAVALANRTRYGLAASLWTRDVARAHRVARRVEAGIVWINSWMVRDLRTPFGGTRDSGLGREGGNYSLEFFTEAKNVFAADG